MECLTPLDFKEIFTYFGIMVAALIVFAAIVYSIWVKD